MPLCENSYAMLIMLPTLGEAYPRSEHLRYLI